MAAADRTKRFFLTGGYAYSNAGDIAILKATIARLHSLYPNSHFVIWTDRKEFSLLLDPSISSELCFYRCPGFFGGARVPAKLLLLAYRLLYPFSQSVVRRVWADRYDPVVRKIKGCDRVLFVGGGYQQQLFVRPDADVPVVLPRQRKRQTYLPVGTDIGPVPQRMAPPPRRDDVRRLRAHRDP